MESSSLDQLFNQIIESERIVEEDRKLLFQVRFQIEQREQLLKTKREKNSSLEQQINDLYKQLYEEKIKMENLQNKQNILSKKKELLQERTNAYSKEHEEMKEQLQLNRVEFCDEMDSFITTSGMQCLKPNPPTTYNFEMELINLKQQQQQLTKVINDFNKSQADVSECQQQKNHQIEHKLKEQQQQLKEFQETLERCKQELQNAKAENEKINLKPSRDPEFQSIREQIHFYQQNNAENERQYAKMQLELKQLHTCKKESQKSWN